MDETTPIAVPDQAPDDTITVPTNAPSTVIPSSDVATRRAAKAELGTGDVTRMNRQQIRDYLLQGREDEFRDSAASSIALDNANKKEQALVQAWRDKGAGLTYEEAIRTIDPFNKNLPEANPNTVIESAYAKSASGVIASSAAYMNSGIYKNAVDQTPEQLALAQGKASKLFTQIEIARKEAQDNEATIAQQGWGSWLVDQAKSMFQPYNEWKLRGLNPDVAPVSGGLLLGNNLKAQADALFNLEPQEFQKRLTEIKQKLNPSQYQEFLSYVLNESASDQKLNNIFTILTPLDYAAIGKGSVKLLRAIDVNQRANVALKQAVQSAVKEGDIPVRAAIQEGVGNAEQAAVVRAADNIDKTINGSLDPVQDIKEKLTSNFRLDGDLLDSNPGTLSRENLTRLKDSFYEAGNSLYESILNAVRVNRTPVPLAAEQALNEFKSKLLQDYPGLHNSILDIGSPVLQKETNTYHIPVTFGNYGGRLFPDAETAYNWAIREGFADPRIQAIEGIVEREPAKLVGTATDIKNIQRLEKSIPENEAFIQKIKDSLSKKFVGPRTPQDIAERKQFIKDATQTVKDYKAQLEGLKKKITYTEPVIEQQGLGYKITVVRPYKETDEVVRSWLLKDKKAQSTGSLPEGADSWKNSFLGWIRGADDTLSYNETLQRKVAVYTQNVLKKWADGEAQAIEDIAQRFKWTRPRTWYGALTGGNKEMFRQWNETVQFAKTAKDPKTGETGYFFKTPGDLEDHYQRYYQRLPTFPEVQAYFAHVKLVEGNRVLSELAEFRNRARLGAEQHQLFHLAADGSRVASGYFDGVQQNHFPQGGGQVLVMGNSAGEERLYNLGANEIPAKTLQKYKEGVAQGKYKVIQIYDPDSHPLQGFSDVAGGNRIRYVVTANSETKPLDINHVNRRGGGHFDIDSDWYVKQADMYDELAAAPNNLPQDKRKNYKKVYRGDKTFMPINNRVMGNDVAEKMTRMNGLIKDQNWAEAEALSRQLGIDWNDMKGYYEPQRAANGHVIGPPRIDVNEPFRLVPRNRKIIDLDDELRTRHGDSFQDAAKSGSLAQQFQVAYNQARDSVDMFSLKNEGTASNPIYKRVPVTYVDPIPTMNRALNRAINSTFMDDYKINAVEHWLAEAMPHLKADESEIRSAPFYHFHTISDKEFVSGTPDMVVKNLLSNRFKIQQFVGMPSSLETSIHSATQLLVDSFYNKFGPEEQRGALARTFTVIPLWALSKAKDPVAGIRSFAFNAKLGVFSIPQFLVQAQTFTNIWGIAPRAGGAGTLATMLHTWARVNSSPEFLQAYDNLATKLNFFGSKWKVGEFIEARNELAKTGFEHVGGEYQLADDALQHKFIKNQWNNFLDAGQVFFREGEKAGRLGAWYTAFREFRDANPLKVITDADRQAILNRADILTNNMSRASASALHTGIWSLPTQFLSYQLRMAELFFGKRLGETLTERNLARARIMSAYALMYGAPSALGVTGYPFGDSIRQEAINRGYVQGANQLSDVLMNGVPAWTLAMVSGGGDYQKGNQYNVGNRYGTQGFTQLRDSFKSDKTVWSLLGGAGASTFLNTLGNLDPFWQAAKSLMSTDEEGNSFKLTPTHFVNLFSEFSSVDSASRAIYALNTGKWLSKNEAYIEDVTGKDVLFRTITGLRSQDQDNIFALSEIRKSEEDAAKAAEKLIIRDFRRGIEATNNKDYDTAQTLFTNARARMIAAGIPFDERARIYAQAGRGYESMINTSIWNWATKNVPLGQEQTRMDAAQTKMNLQEYRNKP